MLVGRLTGPTSDIAQIRRAHHSLTIRRLYSQRLLGLFFLSSRPSPSMRPSHLPLGILSAPFHVAAPFIIHAIFEVYTTLRLLHEENKLNDSLQAFLPPRIDCSAAEPTARRPLKISAARPSKDIPIRPFSP